MLEELKFCSYAMIWIVIMVAINYCSHFCRTPCPAGELQPSDTQKGELWAADSLPEEAFTRIWWQLCPQCAPPGVALPIWTTKKQLKEKNSVCIFITGTTLLLPAQLEVPLVLPQPGQLPGAVQTEKVPTAAALSFSNWSPRIMKSLGFPMISFFPCNVTFLSNKTWVECKKSLCFSPS